MRRLLLIDIFNEIYAVDCVVTKTHLLCGALYLEPMIRTSPIRLTDSHGTVDVQIPAVLLNQREAASIWSAKLLLHIKQPKQRKPTNV